MLFAIGKAYAWSISNGAGYPESYLISGVIDTFVVCALSLFGRSNLVRDIQKINLLSVVVHLYGFIIYMMYFPPYSYDIILTILAIAQWCRLIWVTNGDNNSIDNNFRVDSFLDSHHNLHKSNHAGSNK